MACHDDATATTTATVNDRSGTEGRPLNDGWPGPPHGRICGDAGSPSARRKTWRRGASRGTLTATHPGPCGAPPPGRGSRPALARTASDPSCHPFTFDVPCAAGSHRRRRFLGREPSGSPGESPLRGRSVVGRGVSQLSTVIPGQGFRRCRRRGPRPASENDRGYRRVRVHRHPRGGTRRASPPGSGPRPATSVDAELGDAVGVALPHRSHRLGRSVRQRARAPGRVQP